MRRPGRTAPVRHRAISEMARRGSTSAPAYDSVTGLLDLMVALAGNADHAIIEISDNQDEGRVPLPSATQA